MMVSRYKIQALLNRAATWIGILAPIGVSTITAALVMPTLVPIPFPIALGALSGLFVLISILDFKFRRVPNVLTYPMMAVGIARAILMTDPNFLPYWGAVWILWSMRFFAGGDAKLLMGLFGLWPDIRLVGIIAAVVLVTGIPYLVIQYAKNWRITLKRFVWRIVTFQWLPSEADFEEKAVPFAFSFCLAGAVYGTLIATKVWG